MLDELNSVVVWDMVLATVCLARQPPAVGNCDVLRVTCVYAVLWTVIWVERFKEVNLAKGKPKAK